MAARPGTSMMPRAGPKALWVSCRMAATASGPAKAPIWSMTSWRAKPLPRPTLAAACESMASREGVRRDLPRRSTMTRTDTPATLPAKPMAGTARPVMA